MIASTTSRPSQISAIALMATTTTPGHPKDDPVHLQYLALALDEARKCVATPTAFCVGCVITVPGSKPSSGSDLPDVLSTGYSRELTGNTHAEANALAKAYGAKHEEIDALLANADVYTTLEPCTIRTSGLAPCADALIKAKIKRCFVGVGEPTDFVKCEGEQRLLDAGIEVIWLKGLESECLSEARRGHPAPK